jgi:hypothetical protein
LFIKTFLSPWGRNHSIKKIEHYSPADLKSAGELPEVELVT